MHLEVDGGVGREREGRDGHVGSHASLLVGGERAQNAADGDSNRESPAGLYPGDMAVSRSDRNGGSTGSVDEEWEAEGRVRSRQGPLADAARRRMLTD